MNYAPKNEKKKDNLVCSLREQINGLKEKVQNLQVEEEKLQLKIEGLQRQQGQYRNRKKEISFLIEKLTNDLVEIEELQFSTKVSQPTQRIETILRASGRTLEDYNQGYIPPSVCEELGIPPKIL